MPINQIEAIKRFLNDKDMPDAIYTFLKDRFLKAPKNQDVQYLAASWLAKDFFEEAWKELNKYQSTVKAEAKVESNIGL